MSTADHYVSTKLRSHNTHVTRVCVEGMTGIEPAPSVWKTEALPLSYIPIWLSAEADCATPPYYMSARPRTSVQERCDRLAPAYFWAPIGVPSEGHRVHQAHRDVAQLGRVLGLGPRCRRFDSCHPDISCTSPSSTPQESSISEQAGEPT